MTSERIIIEVLLREAFRAGVDWAYEDEGYLRAGLEPAPGEDAYVATALTALESVKP